ncbi:stage II sporulation protein M [Salinibius halmophilus]|uniref:stage II sporulation protein M n=1 Tax=Salinibius halmophilus TaxID=1853216 RepID=UPI000E65F2CE|nr:stage II sporulation protein M [Salinibius halmophilus]
MKQAQFEQLHRSTWQAQQEAATKKQLPANFGQQHRQICQHLALARARYYSLALITELEQLVQQSHQRLYRQSSRWFALVRLVFIEFPRQLRSDWRYFMVSLIAFIAPGAIAWLLLDLEIVSIYQLIPAQMVSDIGAMYNPEVENIGRVRQSDTDIYMFGFYIWNNVGIALRSFAYGITGGVGALFIMFNNGLFIGSIFQHITVVGYHTTFWPFVIGHGSFELTAIVIAGAAGLRLGWALISPGQLPRLEALKLSAQKAMVLMYGVIFMLLVAAFIEAFWSSTASLGVWPRITVGAMLWALVIGWLTLGGRRAN